MDLSTGFPQLIHSLAVGLALLAGVGALVIALRVRKTVASAPLVSKFMAEVAELAGEHADLVERFARFQKRQDMRAARNELTGQKDAEAEAARIMAERGSQKPSAASKLDLYRRN